MGMSQARLGQGLHGEAVAYLRRTLEKLHQMGAPHREAETLWLLGRANGERGRIEAARSLLNRALNLVREIGDRDDEFRFLADLAQVELAAGHGTGARVGGAARSSGPGGRCGARSAGLGNSCLNPHLGAS